MSAGIETSDPGTHSPRVPWIQHPEWLVRWGLVATLFFVDAAWLAARHIDDELLSFDRMKIAIVFIPIAAALAALALVFRGRAQSLQAVSEVCDSLAQVAAFSSLAVPLASLMAGFGLPFVDDQLAQADRALGFDWLTVSAWVTDHPTVDGIFRWAYRSCFWWQPIVILILGSFARPGERNGEIIWPFMISLLACVVLSALFPAIGYPGVIGVAHIEELQAIRDGHWILMSVAAGGIVTFPSFHASCAVILAYGSRYFWWSLAILGSVDIVMLAATPTVGGHYLVDVIAGSVIAIASIVLWALIARRRRTLVTGRPSWRSMPTPRGAPARPE